MSKGSTKCMTERERMLVAALETAYQALPYNDTTPDEFRELQDMYDYNAIGDMVERAIRSVKAP